MSSRTNGLATNTYLSDKRGNTIRTVVNGLTQLFSYDADNNLIGASFDGRFGVGPEHLSPVEHVTLIFWPF